MKRRRVDQAEASGQSDPVLTWDQLVEREPRLQQLREAIAAVRDDPAEPYCCANEYWFFSHRGPGFVEQLAALVGWHRRPFDPLLGTSDAYDLAYRTLYDLLPDCRGCVCPDARAWRARLEATAPAMP